MMILVQEMVHFLVDVWEEEGLYIWFIKKIFLYYIKKAEKHSLIAFFKFHIIFSVYLLTFYKWN